MSQHINFCRILARDYRVTSIFDTYYLNNSGMCIKNYAGGNLKYTVRAYNPNDIYNQYFILNKNLKVKIDPETMECNFTNEKLYTQHCLNVNFSIDNDVTISNDYNIYADPKYPIIVDRLFSGLHTIYDGYNFTVGTYKGILVIIWNGVYGYIYGFKLYYANNITLFYDINKHKVILFDHTNSNFMTEQINISSDGSEDDKFILSNLYRKIIANYTEHIDTTFHVTNKFYSEISMIKNISSGRY